MGNVFARIRNWCSTRVYAPRLSDDDMAEQARLLGPTPPGQDAPSYGSRGTEQKRPRRSPREQLHDPPPAKRRALLIGICYDQCAPQEELGKLKGPHKDVMELRKLLIDLYGYQERDITVMMDSRKAREDLQPTRENIKRELQALVRNAQSGDRFVVAFSGHSSQRPQDLEHNAFPEEDGQDEVMLCVDDTEIRDNELHQWLVSPLKSIVGASLFALFDTCHSGTMLDLPHHSCNAIYVPWMSKGKRRTGTLRMRQNRGLAYGSFSRAGTLDPVDQLSGIAHMLEQQNLPLVDGPAGPSLDSRKLTLDTRVQPVSFVQASLLRGVSTKLALASSMSHVGHMISDVFVASPLCASPDSQYPCHGWCVYDENWKLKTADIKSLSACMDLQQAWEDRKGRSLVPLFCEYLRHHRKQPITNKDLLTHLSHRIYKNNLKLHEWTLAQKRRARSEGTEAPEGEYLNFQTPELSSLTRLDMHDRFVL